MGVFWGYCLISLFLLFDILSKTAYPARLPLDSEGFTIMGEGLVCCDDEFENGIVY